MNTEAKEITEKAIDTLKRLVELKDYKDKYGKDEHYKREQPHLWSVARTVISVLSDGKPVADTESTCNLQNVTKSTFKWSDNSVIDFTNWYIKNICKLHSRYELENQTIIDTFKKEESE